MTDTKPPVATDEATTAPRHAAIALVLICMAQLMVVLDSTIANIALPYMGTDLNVDDANLQWIVTGYALAFGGLLLVGGRLGDLYGRRNVFMIGVTVFAIASALGGLAQNEAMLLGSRGLQGIGAALASPTALALITTTFPAGPQRNRAFGVFAMMSGLGAAIGLILGGWLTGIDDNWGWRLTFLINVPIGLAAAALAPRFLPDSQRNSGRLDLPGAITGTVALLSLVFGITRTSNTDPDTITATNPNGEAYGWGDPTALIFMGLGVLLLVAFVLIEKRTRIPMLPLNIFANRTRSVAFLAMMITPAAMFAMFFFLSLFVQNIMGYEPLHTGFAFLPFCIGMVAAATVSSNLASKVDPRYLAGIGTLLAGFSLYMFSRLSIDDSPAAIARVATASGVWRHLRSGLRRSVPRPEHGASTSTRSILPARRLMRSSRSCAMATGCTLDRPLRASRGLSASSRCADTSKAYSRPVERMAAPMASVLPPAPAQKSVTISPRRASSSRASSCEPSSCTSMRPC